MDDSAPGAEQAPATNCQSCRRALPGFLCGHATEAEARRVASHLRACSSCLSLSWHLRRELHDDQADGLLEGTRILDGNEAADLGADPPSRARSLAIGLLIGLVVTAIAAVASRSPPIAERLPPIVLDWPEAEPPAEIWRRAREDVEAGRMARALVRLGAPAAGERGRALAGDLRRALAARVQVVAGDLRSGGERRRRGEARARALRRVLRGLDDLTRILDEALAAPSAP